MEQTLFKLRLRNSELVNFNFPAIMGILNVSRNSFYNPFTSLDHLLQTAEQMCQEGADILDIGAEATNPRVNLLEQPTFKQERDAVVVAVESVKKRFDVLISVDTSCPEVMFAAVSAGADIINDQRALMRPRALQMVAKLGVPVCLMHFFQEARTQEMESPQQTLQIIKRFLFQRREACLQAGIDSKRIVIDPGFGQGNYGKNLAENFCLLNNLHLFLELDSPILSGWSRKSMVGDVIEKPIVERLYGSIAADTLAVYQGATIIRTHDVRASREATRVAFKARLFTENMDMDIA